jgi:hypothetical protein
VAEPCEQPPGVENDAVTTLAATCDDSGSQTNPSIPWGVCALN